MEMHEIYSVQKSFYLNIWPSLFQDSFQATIEAELVLSDVYMTDDVHKCFREAVCILVRNHCSLNPSCHLAMDHTHKVFACGGSSRAPGCLRPRSSCPLHYSFFTDGEAL